MKNTHKIAASFAGGAVLVALGVAVSFWAFSQIEHAAGDRKHSFMVINLAGDLLSELKDAETGQRGFALTGDEAFLEQYLVVRDGVSRHLKVLRQLTLTRAAQDHLAALAPLMDAKLAELSGVIELRRNQDMVAVLAIVGSGQGKRLMDSIRVEMKAFLQIENEVLAQHEAQFQSNMRRLFFIIASASLFTLLLSLSFAYLIYRETQHRVRDQVHLETRHLLEIQQLTNDQLQQANVTLQVSEEKLAVTLNSIGDAVIATDFEGRVTRLNPLAEQLTGWTHAQANGRPIDEVFHIINQETSQSATIPVKDTLAHGTLHGLANHTLLIARGGSERAIADTCAPIRDRTGQVVGAVLVFRDVTEEYAARQTLRDNAALIRAILDTVVDGIITLQANGDIVETVNPAAERMFGYTAAELIGKNFSVLMPELDRDHGNGNGFGEYYGASGATPGICLGREVVGRRKDGSFFSMEMAVNEMWLRGQRHFTGILRDITGRKRAEEALLKAGALQNAIFNSANFSCIATDVKGVIQIFNVGAQRMLGYAAEEVVNKITPSDLHDPREMITRATALSLESATPIAPGFEALAFKASRGIEDIYELTKVRKDGSRFPAVVSVTALRDAQNGIIGYLFIGTDNTARRQVEDERKRAEEALRQGEERFRALVTASSDVVYRMSPDWSEMRQLSGRNFIVDTEKPSGAWLQEYIHPDDQPHVMAVINEAIRTKSTFELEHRVRRADSTLGWTFSRAIPLTDAEGEIVEWFGAASDITGRKKAEDEIRVLNETLEERVTQRTAQLQSVNEELATFTYSVSHDLRAPLRQIMGFVKILQEDIGTSLSEESLLHLATIFKAASRMGNLIDDLLAFARVGRVELRKTEIDLDELTREALGDFEKETKERNIVWNIHPLPSVRADRDLLQMVLINLLSNAVKFTGARAEAKIEIGAAPSDNDGTVIYIRDNGAGFNPLYASKLFGAFQRLHSQDEFEGTGIGLASVQRIIHRHGGRSWAEGVVDGGATLYFSLPNQNDIEVTNFKNVMLAAHALHDAELNLVGNEIPTLH